ncbi:MAG TPA: chromosome segregation protein SMC [Caulobacteraceae bacterium]|nr:chromosome segregation protein SMC [Caulobacteraceae bacterium]
MHFAKLRLSGFKSFVEPTELRIESGVTGIVGPNGCGKSNLLEALRWVMGAASAKAMRGEGMDDVIFAGSGARPARNHAEVALTIDNEDRAGPAEWSGPVIEVSRRIDRAEGSTFRINGKEARARDVQLLFADASTGANSPALVRQGQISELISAKPQNRRRILEEAAGVAGLHSRRHEAELKVRAAEANLERLDDLARELESTLARLRREARQATRYREISAEIRTLRAALLIAAWREASHAFAAARALHDDLGREAETAALEAARAGRSAIAAAEAAAPAQAEERAAAAQAHGAEIELERLDRRLEAMSAEADRLAAEIQRIAADSEREAQIGRDATQALEQLRSEEEALRTARAEAAETLARLQTGAEAASAARSAAETELERLTAAAAADQARREAAQTRVVEAQRRVEAADKALAAARQQELALGPPPRGSSTADAAAAAETALAEAASALERADEARAAAAEAEAAARAGHRAREDELAALVSQAEGLAAVAAAPGRARVAPVVERVKPRRGLEAAVAAALGDDLLAGLEAGAGAWWAGAHVEPAPWPAGATSLVELVEAPSQLAARLSLTALVERADGARLQTSLVPGARLVSREGDLWRWDGYTAPAGGPRPAQARLEQRTRLEDLETQIAALRPAVRAAAEAHASAAAELAAREAAAAAGRRALLEAEQVLAKARAALAAAEREAARRESEAAVLAQRLEDLALEAESGRAALAQAKSAAQAAFEPASEAASIEALRSNLSEARAAEAAAGSALAVARRDGAARDARLAAIASETDSWRGRAQAAAMRVDSLAVAADRAASERAAALAAPSEAGPKRQLLLDALAAAQQRRSQAGEALAAAEGARAVAESAARAAQAGAEEARAALSEAHARLEGERARLDERRARIAEVLQIAPEAVEARLSEDSIELPADLGAGEVRLAELERARDAIGPVNLLAEREAADLAVRAAALAAERADLAGALERLRLGIGELNAEGRERLLAAFDVVDGHFRSLFQTLFEGGQAELRLVEADDPLEAGLEIYACPPGKRLAIMTLLSGGEQALTALALILAVFLSNPAPICVLDEVDAPLDDANVERFCALLDDMRRRAPTRFLVITHNPLTMSRMDRLFGVTMPERGVSQLVSVDLRQAETLAAA